MGACKNGPAKSTTDESAAVGVHTLNDFLTEMRIDHFNLYQAHFQATDNTQHGLVPGVAHESMLLLC